MMEHPQEVPDWLLPVPIPTSDLPSRVAELSFENMFPIVIDRLMEGVPLATQLACDGRDVNMGQFLAWVFKNKNRKREYYDALKVFSEIMFQEMIGIADASNIEIDTKKVMLDTRKYYQKVVDKPRFGDVKTLDVTTRTVTEENLKTLPLTELASMILNGDYDDEPDQEQTGSGV